MAGFCPRASVVDSSPSRSAIRPSLVPEPGSSAGDGAILPAAHGALGNPSRFESSEARSQLRGPAFDDSDASPISAFDALSEEEPWVDAPPEAVESDNAGQRIPDNLVTRARRSEILTSHRRRVRPIERANAGMQAAADDRFARRVFDALPTATVGSLPGWLSHAHASHSLVFMAGVSACRRCALQASSLTSRLEAPCRASFPKGSDRDLRRLMRGLCPKSLARLLRPGCFPQPVRVLRNLEVSSG